MKRCVIIGGLLIVWLAGGISMVALAQAVRPSSAAPDDEILAEVRGLRADLVQAMSVTTRAQLLVGRLQLQEQRMNALAAQLTDVRRSLAGEETERAKLEERLTGAQEMLDLGLLSPDQRRDVESEVRALRHELSRPHPRRDELRAQETQLSGQLVSEQGRWINVNNRLDEIEASLPEAARPAPRR